METDADRRHAEARLRYLGDLQRRTRRASVTPWLPLIALGAVAVVHGLVATAWPDARRVDLVWFAGLLAVRPAMHWLRRRQQQKRGVEATVRIPVASAIAAALAVTVAGLVGINPFIAAVASATAAATYLVGLPSVAAAALAVGVIGELAIGSGVPGPVVEMIVGVGLIATGFTCFAHEQEAQ